MAGHGISAIVGVFCGQHLGHGWLAAGCAVGLAILAMHGLKCIHPPGGATAMTAIIGGNEVHEMGYYFVVWPVMANALILLTIAVIFNWSFPWRRYPAVFSRLKHPIKPHPFGRENVHEDVLKALRTMDSFVDITEADLMALTRIIAREREARLIKESRKLDGN